MSVATVARVTGEAGISAVPVADEAHRVIGMAGRTGPDQPPWREPVLCLVANLTRADGEAFLALAPRVPVRTAATTLPPEAANAALDRLRAGEVRGARVLRP